MPERHAARQVMGFCRCNQNTSLEDSLFGERQGHKGACCAHPPAQASCWRRARTTTPPRSGAWPRTRRCTTSLRTPRRSTPSSGRPQGPARTTPGSASCSCPPPLTTPSGAHPPPPPAPPAWHPPLHARPRCCRRSLLRNGSLTCLLPREQRGRLLRVAVRLGVEAAGSLLARARAGMHSGGRRHVTAACMHTLARSMRSRPARCPGAQAVGRGDGGLPAPPDTAHAAGLLGGLLAQRRAAGQRQLRPQPAHLVGRRRAARAHLQGAGRHLRGGAPRWRGLHVSLPAGSCMGASSRHSWVSCRFVQPSGVLTLTCSGHAVVRCGIRHWCSGVRDAKVHARDPVRQVCWAKDGDRVAACFSNKVVSVLDLRM